MQTILKSNRLFLCFAFIFLFSTTGLTQNFLWAYTTNYAPRTQSVAIKVDEQGNYYLATRTDSINGSTHVYTQLEKKDATNLLLWQIKITGKVVITDIEINAANHCVAVGYFTNSITIGANTLTSTANKNSGFIFECDENGTVLWSNKLDPLNNEFRAGDLFIEKKSGAMYATAIVSGTGGNCAFFKLSKVGTIVKSEYTTNFDNRTFTRIIADSTGKVFISGTCGNFANFDAIHPDPNYSYQNFFIVYDSSFTAQSIICKKYITFDDNNRLTTDGKYYYWVFDDYTIGSLDTVRIIKLNSNGQFVSSADAPFPSVNFPAIDFATDSKGNSLFITQAYTRLYLYRLDSSFNITWNDTLYSKTSGFPITTALSCYDSCFYLSSFYLGATLFNQPLTITNPNYGTTTYPSDVFVCKWGYDAILPVSLTHFSAVKKDQSIQLNWNIANETGIDKYVVEKSSDNNQFTAIATVKPGLQLYNDYFYSDKIINDNNRELFYRIKIVNQTGKASYSKIIRILLSRNIETKILSNPVNDKVDIVLQLEKDEKLDLKIISTSGKIMYRKTAIFNKGSNYFSLDAAQLSSGNYFISISNNDIQKNIGFIKL